MKAKEKEIVVTVNKELLSKELTADKFVKHTNKGQNEIYQHKIERHITNKSAMKEAGKEFFLVPRPSSLVTSSGSVPFPSND